MMQVISRSAYEILHKHLVELEGKVNDVIETYFADTVESREDFLRLIDNYVSRLTSIMDSSKKVESQDEELPLVIIGSEVEVENVEEQKTCKFLITSPFAEHSTSSDTECASCLSPVGRALLLKRPAEQVSVTAPTQTFHYKIRSIRLVET
ncbi:MAG: GreA/GreB family elongation factor [Clostridia bacterium]|jgi:transcription elongation factor GreA